MARKTKKRNEEDIFDKEFRPLAGLISFVLWLTGILVALAVGSAMIEGILTVPLVSGFLEGIIVKIAGYVVVILTILGVVLKIMDSLWN